MYVFIYWTQREVGGFCMGEKGGSLTLFLTHNGCNSRSPSSGQGCATRGGWPRSWTGRPGGARCPNTTCWLRRNRGPPMNSPAEQTQHIFKISIGRFWCSLSLNHLPKRDPRQMSYTCFIWIVFRSKSLGEKNTILCSRNVQHHVIDSKVSTRM